MTNAALQRYHARMQRVLDYIDRHLDGDLNLDSLSSVAAMSKHHFHRQFAAIFGMSVHRYVHTVRMKRASYRLAYRTGDPVTEIALDAGYEAPEAFSRAFRQRFGQAPSAFRKAPDWAPWQSAILPRIGARTMTSEPHFTTDDVTIIDVPDTPVALIEHRGDAVSIGDTIRRFIGWRKSAGLSPKTSATFNIFHNDPETTPAADYRLDICAATERAVAPNDAGVEAGLIPGGRCAVLRLKGSSDDLSAASTFLYRDLLPASGEEPRNFPFYCQRVSFFPDVPEHEAVTDLFVPLQ